MAGSDGLGELASRRGPTWQPSRCHDPHAQDASQAFERRGRQAERLERRERRRLVDLTPDLNVEAHTAEEGREVVNKMCGEYYDRGDCTAEAKEAVRALLPWIGDESLQVFVGRTIYTFYR